MNFALLILVGFFVGVVGGMFGVGGGIILIPALNEVLGPNQHLYQATAMIVNMFVAVPAIYQHHSARAIEFRTVFRVIPLSIAAVFLGVAVSELAFFAGPGEANLRALFGAFLLACALYDAYRLWHQSPSPPGRGVRGEGSSAFPFGNGQGDGDSVDNAPPAMTWKAALAVAIPTGFFSGLLGVGGGIVAVPLQRHILHVPMRTAIANSAAIIVATSLVGALFKNYAYLSEDGTEAHPMVLAAVLIPTAIVGSLLGSHLTHRIPLRAVKGAFVIVLVAAAIRLIQGAFARP